MKPHTESTKGRLLVASPTLLDPNFHRTVVLMLEHNHDGAIGVVLNRSRFVGGSEAVPLWADRLAHPCQLHDGGPVSKDSVIGLGLTSEVYSQAAPAESGVTPLLGCVGVLDLHRNPSELPEVTGVRLFAGYAGWSGGQLDAELNAGGWIIADAREEDVVTDDAGGLWQTVLARQDGLTSLLARYPDDPAMN